MRCEDFPCCGHYEASTGEIFCYEANRTPAERKADELRAEADRLRAEADAMDARQIEYHKALDRDHDDERCDNGEPCEECFIEGEEAEQDARHYEDAHDYAYGRDDY